MWCDIVAKTIQGNCILTQAKSWNKKPNRKQRMEEKWLFVSLFRIPTFNYFIYTIIQIRVFGFVGKFDSMHCHSTERFTASENWGNCGTKWRKDVFSSVGWMWMWKKHWKQNLLSLYRNQITIFTYEWKTFIHNTQ